MNIDTVSSPYEAVYGHTLTRGEVLMKIVKNIYGCPDEMRLGDWIHQISHTYRYEDIADNYMYGEMGNAAPVKAGDGSEVIGVSSISVSETEETPRPPEKPQFIADDVSHIARRLKELEAEKAKK